jgi:uncharacterized protein with HEPN domain
MQLEAKKYLYDIQQAANLLARFVDGKTFADYEADQMLRSAVERQFGIIGEAMSQLAKLDESVASRVSQHGRIISFRNLLIHDYGNVDDHLVWDIVESKLPALRREVTALLGEP